jgi:outer membrane protein assembly factor BamB
MLWYIASYQKIHVNRGLLVTLAFSCAMGCSAKKLIVLPNKGDRVVVYTDSGDTLKITNKTITLRPLPAVKNLQYQGDIGVDRNYAGQFGGNKQKEKAWARDGLSNVLIQEGILYYTNNDKIQRYDLKQHKALETPPFVISKPTILSVQGNLLVVVTDGELSVYDLHKKKTILKQGVKELVTKRPLISKNRLFVQTQSDDLICFDLTSAKEVWRYTHSKHDTYIFQNDRYAGLVTWNNNIIFVTAGGDIVVLDMDTKEPYWVYPSTSVSELTLNVPFTPIVSGDALYLAKKDTGLLRLNLKERALVWERPSIQTTVQPCIYGDHIFVAHGKTIIAVDRKTGAALYQTAALPESIVSAPFVQNNHLVVASKAHIFRLSLTTGKVESELQSPALQQVFPYGKGLGVIGGDRLALS